MTDDGSTPWHEARYLVGVHAVEPRVHRVELDGEAVGRRAEEMASVDVGRRSVVGTARGRVQSATGAAAAELGTARSAGAAGPAGPAGAARAAVAALAAFRVAGGARWYRRRRRQSPGAPRLPSRSRSQRTSEQRVASSNRTWFDPPPSVKQKQSDSIVNCRLNCALCAPSARFQQSRRNLPVGPHRLNPPRRSPDRPVKREALAARSTVTSARRAIQPKIALSRSLLWTAGAADRRMAMRASTVGRSQAVRARHASSAVACALREIATEGRERHVGRDRASGQPGVERRLRVGELAGEQPVRDDAEREDVDRRGEVPRAVGELRSDVQRGARDVSRSRELRRASACSSAASRRVAARDASVGASASAVSPDRAHWPRRR